MVKTAQVVEKCFVIRFFLFSIQFQIRKEQYIHFGNNLVIVTFVDSCCRSVAELLYGYDVIGNMFIYNIGYGPSHRKAKSENGDVRYS